MLTRNDQPGPTWYKWLYTWFGTHPKNQPFTYWMRRHPLVLVGGMTAVGVLLGHVFW